jgi:hypothetical protein
MGHTHYWVIPMSTNAYIKYLTQQVVQYFNLTKMERKENRQQRKGERTSPVSTWFGILPFALSMFFKKVSKRKRMS